MKKYLFDIETNGYLHECTRCWIVYLLDLSTMEKSYYLEGDEGWKRKLSEADMVVGHNILGFDLPALRKLFGFQLKKECKVRDTLILSQILNYKRFGEEGHSLQAWGIFLGLHKGDWTDFSVYHPGMLGYCETDIDINFKVYEIVMAEAIALIAKSPQLKHYIQAEHAVAKWAADANYSGWPFDREGAQKLHSDLEREIGEIREKLESRLGYRMKATDKVKGEVEIKSPKWTMKGDYNHHVAKWFGVDPSTGMDEDRLIDGDYCRVEALPLKLSSPADVKRFLFRHGWIPTEYNFKLNPVTMRKEETSPKISDDSLEYLGGDGELYRRYTTLTSRYSIISTWLENVDDKGNLHGDCFTIGTPSMRLRHKIIVNVPGSDSLLGPEMRDLFRAYPGWKVVGCDSKGNQARGLAHYLKNPEFTDILINGDIHVYNAEKLEEVLAGLGVGWDQVLTNGGVKADEEHTLEEALAVRKRNVAKRILYAFLFGASGGKLWSYIFGTPKARQGNMLKKGFTAAVPGFKKLLDRLESIYGKTSQQGYGYIPSAAGTRIYVDSFHKLLVYLLQSLEKITCSSAVMLTAQWLEDEQIPYIPLIFMHDEIQFMVPEEHAERAAELGAAAFREGPKLFGVEIMDGDSMVGDSWKETH